MKSTPVLAALFGGAQAYFALTDPSDQLSPIPWEVDNAQATNYSYAPASDQYIPNVAPYIFNSTTSLVHQYYSVDANDTSVVIFEAGGSLEYVTVLKEGYNSDLYQASFYGVNAAVLNENQTVYLSDINVTVHNGAANIYTYGAAATTYVNNAWLYSSGPVSHGLYASEYGTVIGTNIVHYSGGKRASSFSGDTPVGYVHVTNAVAHTDGIGSATCYALGLCNMTNVIGHTSNAPSMFMDGNDLAYWTNCDLTAGLLAGFVIFSGMVRVDEPAVTHIDHTRLTTLGSTMPSLWYGNVLAETYIVASEFNNTASGLFVVANFSQVTQAFDEFVGYDQNSALSAATTYLYVSESAIYGDLVAYNGSEIDIAFANYTHFTGKGYSGYEESYISISLDETSYWTLTGPTTLTNFTDADTTFSNVESKGFNIYYDETSDGNDYLKNATYALPGGGKLTPAGDVNLRASHKYWGGYGEFHTKTPTVVDRPWGTTAPGDVLEGL